MSDGNEPYAIDDMAAQTGYKESTIMSHLAIFKRQGAYEANGRWLFPYGTRYPFFARSSELTSTDRVYRAILRATNQKLYVDNVSLSLTKEEFDVMIDQLVSEGYLAPNGIHNEFGANAYTCSPKATSLIQGPRKKALDTLSSLAGPIVSVISVAVNARVAGII